MPTSASPIEPTDPRERFAKPPFPQGKQKGAGSANELDPPADYGEATYQGHGRLLGRAALITGRIVASAGPSHYVSRRRAPTSCSRSSKVMKPNRRTLTRPYAWSRLRVAKRSLYRVTSARNRFVKPW